MLFETVLAFVICLGAEAQEVAFPRIKPAKYAKPKHAYGSSQFYPNVQPSALNYKAIPPFYHPSDICFNPNYYGFMRAGDMSQISPIPQPNLYYNLPSAQPVPYGIPAQYPTPLAQPGYTPWTWNTYPYTGQPMLPYYPMQPKIADHLPNALVGAPHNQPVENQVGTCNQTVEKLVPECVTKPPITITRPTVSVKITPPVFNENGTMVMNAFKEPNVDDEPEQNTKLDEKTRTMIMHLLELGSKHKSSEPKNARGRGDMAAESDEEFVITPARRRRSNIYPMPKTVYGTTNEPSSIYDKWEIFNEFIRP